jgi:hypothetical protein
MLTIKEKLEIITSLITSAYDRHTMQFRFKMIGSHYFDLFHTLNQYKEDLALLNNDFTNLLVEDKSWALYKRFKEEENGFSENFGFEKQPTTIGVYLEKTINNLINIFAIKDYNTIIYTPNSMHKHHCFDCGKDFKGSIVFDLQNNTMKAGEDIPECAYDNTLKATITSIDIKDEIIFSNYFDNLNFSPNKNYQLSLNNSLGLELIEKEYAKHNFLHAQTGNMGVMVYKKDDNFYLLSDTPDTEDFGELIGEISCSVWSVCATDTTTLKDTGANVPEEYVDSVSSKTTSGTYQMTYNWRNGSDNIVIAAIELVA